LNPADLLPSLGRPVAYYPELVKITGSVSATLFLCQLFYWDGKQSDRAGWIFKTQDEIEKETGLSRWEQQTARRVLGERGFIREKYAGMPRKVHYRVMKKSIYTAWKEHCARTSVLGNQHVGSPRTGMRKSHLSVCGNATHKSEENHHALYTEITHKNTSKSTTTLRKKQDGKQEDEEQWKERYMKELDAFPLSPEIKDMVLENGLRQRRESQYFEKFKEVD
jgi:hypothetical protein